MKFAAPLKLRLGQRMNVGIRPQINAADFALISLREQSSEFTTLRPNLNTMSGLVEILEKGG